MVAAASARVGFMIPPQHPIEATRSMSSLTLSEEHGATAEEVAPVLEGLLRFNDGHRVRAAPEPLQILLRDESGAIQGGLLAATRWHWLLVQILWVADDHRGRGHGSALLGRAEAIARVRGCRKAALDTAAFQALGFYQKAGYRIFGELDDNPPGSKTFYLEKDLAGA